MEGTMLRFIFIILTFTIICMYNYKPFPLVGRGNNVDSGMRIAVPAANRPEHGEVLWVTH